MLLYAFAFAGNMVAVVALYILVGEGAATYGVAAVIGQCGGILMERIHAR